MSTPPPKTPPFVLLTEEEYEKCEEPSKEEIRERFEAGRKLRDALEAAMRVQETETQLRIR